MTDPKKKWGKEDYSDKAEEYEEEILKELDSLVNEEVRIQENNLVEILKKHAKVVPSIVPVTLECTPTEFLELPIEHFTKLCDKHSYNKIISSLTYIQNIASRDDQLIKARATELKSLLKQQRTTAAKESQNKQEIPPAPEASSGTKPANEPNQSQEKI